MSLSAEGTNLEVEIADVLVRIEEKYQDQLDRQTREIARLIRENATLETMVAQLLKERST